MSIILITGYNEPYAELASLTVPRMKKFAERNGMDFKAYTEPPIDSPNGIYWTGVYGSILALAEGYDSVMYLDVDQLITNFDWSFPFESGCNVSLDWGLEATEPWMLSMCGMMCFSDAFPLLHAVAHARIRLDTKEFPEQDLMRQACREGWGDIKVHPRKLFNNVPDMICPSKVAEPWKFGDFAAHLTMLPLPERVTMAKLLLSML